jgi:glutaredoxin
MNYIALFCILFSGISTAAKDSLPGKSDDGCEAACDIDSLPAHETEDDVLKQDLETFRKSIHSKITDGKIYLYLFHTNDCPRCAKMQSLLEELKAENPELEIQQYEISQDNRNRNYFQIMLTEHGLKAQGVPTVFVGDKAFTGFYEKTTRDSILTEIMRLKGSAKIQDARQFNIPFIGTIDAGTISLPAFTVYIGLLDGLNPCAMWVLTFLLGLMVYSRDRFKIIFVGSVFVLSSDVVYFLFMTAWLNLFLVIGYSKIITLVLGTVAILIGMVNVKELFFFKKGVSLTIPDAAKPKLYKRVRKLLHEKNTLLTVTGVITLAVFVNFIELGCTIGLPAIYTKILSIKKLPSSLEYLYLALYNIAYVVPLAVIVGLFALTLGHFKLSEKHAKILKVVSGLLMIFLGAMMVFKPDMLKM